MTESAGPAVTVVVPVLNDAQGVRACLDALLAQRARFSFEVIVVDNGSHDDTQKEAAWHPLRPLVLTEQRRGSYAARNAGIAAARAPLLAFTDADCVPDPHWLAQGVLQLSRTDAAGGRIAIRVGDRAGIWEQWDAAHYLNQRAYVADGFAATANFFARADVFDRVGRFDPALLSSGDLEWGIRSRRAGVSLAYADDALVSHRARSSARETWRLHRRLGAGWRELARRGMRPSAWRDPFMRPRFREVVEAARARGYVVSPYRLGAAHVVVVAARWCGRLTGR